LAIILLGCWLLETLLLGLISILVATPAKSARMAVVLWAEAEGEVEQEAELSCWIQAEAQFNSLAR
jgi:hypothetical protein